MSSTVFSRFHSSWKLWQKPWFQRLESFLIIFDFLWKKNGEDLEDASVIRAIPIYRLRLRVVVLAPITEAMQQIFPALVYHEVVHLGLGRIKRILTTEYFN